MPSSVLDGLNFIISNVHFLYFYKSSIFSRHDFMLGLFNSGVYGTEIDSCRRLFLVDDF
ncbi:hypothetical protein EMIT0P265_250003 [Pseudomonas zeae]